MIEIQLISATQVVTPARALVGRDFGGVKVRQLLELLALDLGLPVSKDRLAELLWDGRPPGSWTTTLEGYVSLLRSRLQPGISARRSVIRTVTGGYLLDPDEVTVDVHEVASLVRQARPARAGVALPMLQRALELADQELLRDSAGASWAQSARACHLKLRVELSISAAGHALHLGRHELAADLADAALALDPVAEQACRLAMQGLWATGRTAEAVRRHTELRTVLAEELGVDPAPETQELFVRLMRDDAPRPGLLPRRRTDRPLTAAGAPERSVDALAAAIVLALRRAPGASGGEDDPVLVAKLADLLAHLQGTASPSPLALVS